MFNLRLERRFGRGSSKPVIGSPVLKQTTNTEILDIPSRENSPFAQVQRNSSGYPTEMFEVLPPLPPKDGPRDYASTSARMTSRTQNPSLSIDPYYNSGGTPPPEEDDQPSPVSPLSTNASVVEQGTKKVGMKKYYCESISPPNSIREAPNHSRENLPLQGSYLHHQQPSSSYNYGNGYTGNSRSQTPTSFESSNRSRPGVRNYEGGGGYLVNNSYNPYTSRGTEVISNTFPRSGRRDNAYMGQVTKERGTTDNYDDRSRSPKPPSPPPANVNKPLPRLNLRNSVFVPLRNSLANSSLPPLPPLPAIHSSTSSFLPDLGISEEPEDLVPESIRPESLDPTPKASPTIPETKYEPLPNTSDSIYGELYARLGKSTTAPISKPAPIIPLAPKTHLGKLEEKKDELERKKSGLKEKIAETEESVVKYGTMSASRRLTNERLDKLRNELADVERELHDLGIKIYRANRKKNDAEGVEGNQLWVRRITVD